MKADTFNEKLILLKQAAKDLDVDLGITIVNIRLKTLVNKDESEAKQIVATDDIEWFVLAVITAPATLTNNKK